MNNKQNFIAHLQTSFRDYFTVVKQSPIERAQAKSYINGLMVAGKIFGISSDELQQILSQEQSFRSTPVTQDDRYNSEIINIPAYIRNPMQHSK
ncbi:hypothetical protein [Oceanisphaera arctica]|uniref:hypothetical protein n=1 Tax=Oceanisphaera arctica TaxID=641510 RepID=UPI0011B0BF81|nr:hypothetical protein [Oceanisphaera arctica]GHA18912.1 hypothetical protein GCM10007082_19480 [Oceanisphaera arctica]